MTGRPAPQVILFDLGGVLLPFDQERRIAALVGRFGCAAETARAFMADAIHWRLSLGEAGEVDLADAFTAAFGEQVAPSRGRRAGAERVRGAEPRALGPGRPPAPRARRSAASATIRASSIGCFPPAPASSRCSSPATCISSSRRPRRSPRSRRALACRARRSSSSTTRSPTSRRRARAGWDAIHFTSNAALTAELAARGLP